MSKARIESLGEGRYRLDGDMTFATVTALLPEGAAMIAAAGEALAIDLAAVGRVDSAGLALLIEWLRSAREAGKTITYHHTPEQMLAMARLSSLDVVLPLEPAQG